MLKGLLTEKKENIWKIEMIKYEIDKISQEHDIKNIFCVKVADSETDSCEATVQSDNWEEERQKNFQKLSKSHKLVPIKISTVRTVRKSNKK